MLKKVSIFLLIIVLGCKNQLPISESLEKKQTSGVFLSYIDASIKPGDNFTAYVNGNGLQPKMVEFYKFTRSINSNIISSVISKQGSLSSDEQKIKDLYQSFINFKKRDSIGVLPLKQEFSKIDAIKTTSGLMAYFAYANIYGYEVPLKINVNNKKQILLEKGGLQLGNSRIYVNTDNKRYKNYIKNLFTKTGFFFDENTISSIVELETKLAKIHQNIDNKSSNESTVFTLNKLNNVVPKINWDRYFKEAFLSMEVKTVVSSQEYLQKLAGLIEITELSVWKSYLKWALLFKGATFLNKSIYNAYASFYGINISENFNREAVRCIKDNLQELISKKFVKTYCTDKVKKRVEDIVLNIQKAYVLRIKKLDWMSSKSKEEALDKLKKLRKIIGYVDNWTDYNDLVITPNNLYENIRQLNLFNYKQSLTRLLEDSINSNSKRFSPLIPNGYFMPSENKIWISAMLFSSPPYFTESAEEAINYGAIGAVIGHELGHAFDSNGSLYDSKGVKRDWLVKEDRQKLNKKMDTLVKQYDAYEIIPGHYVNGKETLGENLADLTGLSMAIEAYKRLRKDDIIIDGFTSLQRIFIGYASIYDNVSNNKYFLNNPQSKYPPSKFRVNGVVRNIDEFYEAFQVKPTDSLYLSPNKRLKIW
ncbi:M13-type metalloendopeptidase [Polaribacter cellanae]|uniref:M13 family metallopeptidase n=1 Tax=Polaribacter cellanae TaxID=2818493 RepID=A0A975CNG6_9FLAO|nr:M13 family metallopeptidase [Polaribacter cellanae]QTE22564.1 M13 family metallopeptidase [Polaribacter cellanae]